MATKTKLRPAQVLDATVTAVTPHGIHLRKGSLEILVHVTDVPWGAELDPAEYAKVGDVVPVTILRVVGDGRAASGWLPWPARPKSGSPGSAASSPPTA